MNTLTSYGLGPLSLTGLAGVAQGCVNALVAPTAGFGATTQKNENAGLIVAGIATVVVALIAARFAAGWYIGKQFGRPGWGAVAGGFAGPVGLGIVSLVPGNRY